MVVRQRQGAAEEEEDDMNKLVPGILIALVAGAQGAQEAPKGGIPPAEGSR